MRILVTGGAGFIGSNIVDKLIELGYEVAVIDNISTGKIEKLNSKAKFYKLDITDAESMIKTFMEYRPEVCIHHAAQVDVQKSIKEPMFDLNVNIVGTLNILEACIKSNVRKIIYASSAAAYGEPQYLPVDELHKTNPISLYGISKHTPEHHIEVYGKLHGLNYTILRYSNAYGIRQEYEGEGGVIAIFLNKIIQDETPVIYGDGKQTRDFIYVKDIVEANVTAINKGDNEIINISNNNNISINELVEVLAKICNKNIQPSYKDARGGDIIHSYMDNKKASVLLGWEPKYSLEEGLKETLQYYISLEK